MSTPDPKPKNFLTQLLSFIPRNFGSSTEKSAEIATRNPVREGVHKADVTASESLNPDDFSKLLEVINSPFVQDTLASLVGEGNLNFGYDPSPISENVLAYVSPFFDPRAVQYTDRVGDESPFSNPSTQRSTMLHEIGHVLDFVQKFPGEDIVEQKLKERDPEMSFRAKAETKAAVFESAYKHVQAFPRAWEAGLDSPEFRAWTASLAVQDQYNPGLAEVVFEMANHPIFKSNPLRALGVPFQREIYRRHIVPTRERQKEREEREKIRAGGMGAKEPVS